MQPMVSVVVTGFLPPIRPIRLHPRCNAVDQERGPHTISTKRGQFVNRGGVQLRSTSPKSLHTLKRKTWGVRSVVVSTRRSHATGSGSIPGPGMFRRDRVYYSCSATSSARDVKQGCSLRTHAFKIMRGLKRTWMTKRKSRGPETYRHGRHLNPTKAEWSWLHTRHFRLLESLSVQCGNPRVNGLTRNPNKGIAKKTKTFILPLQ